MYGYMVWDLLVGQDVGFHLEVPARLCLPHDDLEKVGGDGDVVLPDDLELNVALSVRWVHFGQVQRARAHVHVPVNLGQASCVPAKVASDMQLDSKCEELPFQMFPFVSVEASPNLRAHVGKEEGLITDGLVHAVVASGRQVTTVEATVLQTADALLLCCGLKVKSGVLKYLVVCVL